MGLSGYWGKEIGSHVLYYPQNIRAIATFAPLLGFPASVYTRVRRGNPI